MNRLCALIALLASGCSLPEVQPINVSRDCEYIENARGEVLAICNYEPVANVAAKDLM